MIRVTLEYLGPLCSRLYSTLLTLVLGARSTWEVSGWSQLTRTEAWAGMVAKMPAASAPP